MKKLIVLMVALAMVFALAGCNRTKLSCPWHGVHLPPSGTKHNRYDDY